MEKGKCPEEEKKLRAIYLESKLECSFFVFLTLIVTKNLLQHMKMFNLNLDVPFTNRLEKKCLLLHRQR